MEWPPQPCLRNSRECKSIFQGSARWVDIKHVVLIITQLHVHSCFHNATFDLPSNSMTSILSPCTSWPTNWKPFFSKSPFSKGFTYNEQRFNEVLRLCYKTQKKLIKYIRIRTQKWKTEAKNVYRQSKKFCVHRQKALKLCIGLYLESVSVSLVNMVQISIQFFWNNESCC